MATYVVNYDLRKPGRNYEDLFKELKKFQHWCHFLESAWFVISDRTASQVHAQLRQRIDSGDGLVVTEIRRGNSAWVGLTDEVSAWLKSHL